MPASTPHTQQPAEYNPFDELEFLPGLGAAVLWVVAALVLVHVLLLPAATR